MKARYFFILAVGAGLVAIGGLRANATQSLNLRNAIINADLAGKPVTELVVELRNFVFTHMNSSVRFDLVGSYQRAVDKIWVGSVDVHTYESAQSICDSRGGSSTARVDCVERYLSEHTGSSTQLPPRGQYAYAFAAPSWSPDMAGLGLLAAIALVLAALIIYVVQIFRSRPPIKTA